MLRQRGFSLVELMIAITIGLLISTGLALVFVNSTKASQEVKRFGEQIENGRIAMDMSSQDLRTAGFWSTLDSTTLANPTGLVSPEIDDNNLPNPCSTTLATLIAAMPVHIQGYDNDDGNLSCLPDYKSGTDVVVIRRASTIANSPSADPATYFQASQCNPVNGSTELAGPVSGQFAVGAYADLTNLHQRNCTTTADRRRYIAHIYYVTNSTENSDGIPGLKMLELGQAGDSQFSNNGTAIIIAPGIEDFQVEYGADVTDGAGVAGSDGIPDTWSATPPTTTNFRSIVAVRLNFLSRNSTASPGYTDTKTYVLGKLANGNDNVVPAKGDRFRRHVYTSNIILTIPAGLRGGA